MLRSTGAKRRPMAVREYSTRGGTSGYTVRYTSPSFSMYFSWDDSVAWVIWISRSRSLNLFVPSLRACRIRMAHFPCSSFWAVTKGQTPNKLFSMVFSYTQVFHTRSRKLSFLSAILYQSYNESKYEKHTVGARLAPQVMAC